MRTTHSIGVALLHQDQVVPHCLVGDSPSIEVVMVISIDAVKDDWLAIDVKVGVFGFDAAETSALTDYTAAK